MGRVYSIFFAALCVSTVGFTATGPFQPLPKSAPVPSGNKLTPEKINLGKMLFFDPRLSKDGTLSCNSCHNVMGSGTDNRKFSVGVGGKLGGRNSPTVWNAAFLSVQFWDGREPSLEAQSKGPLTNPVEMAMDNHDLVVSRIKQIPGYVTLFGKDPITIENVAKAIASYERTLITPNSPFDRYLRGEKKAISTTAEKGYKKVVEVGCITCHQGVNFAGPEMPEGLGFFQKFPLFADNEYVAKYDLVKDGGRFEATKKEEDRGMWRVPTWRNISLTAPYLHNGSVATLDEVVRVMAKTQLNRTLKETEVTEIVEFLQTLTGVFPKQEMPHLPDLLNKTLID